MKINAIRGIGIPPYTFLLFSSSLCYSLNTQADSWTVTQTTTLNADAQLSQTNTSHHSTQAANIIHLDPDNGVVINANQTLTTTGKRNLTLLQEGTDNSHQAGNFISAAQINQATQTINNINTLTLNQQNAGSNNIQAGNMATATAVNAQIDILTQTLSADSVTMTNSGTNNIQAGNYAKADTIANGTQNFNVTNNVSFNGNGSGNIQAGNYIEADSGNVTQNFNVTGNLTYQQQGSHNIQAGNVVVHNTASFTGSITQNFSAANVEVNFVDNNSGSVKAANYIVKK